MKIDGVTIAVKNVEAMVTFYNSVFDASLASIPETPFYQGRMGDLQLIFCPNSLLEIQAERSLFQFRLAVDDVDGMVAKAEAAGGSEYGERREDDEQIVWGFADPDGNTFEIYHALGD